jgi:hypothetical protein
MDSIFIIYFRFQATKRWPDLFFEHCSQVRAESEEKALEIFYKYHVKDCEILSILAKHTLPEDRLKEINKLTKNYIYGDEHKN